MAWSKDRSANLHRHVGTDMQVPGRIVVYNLDLEVTGRARPIGLEAQPRLSSEGQWRPYELPHADFHRLPSHRKSEAPRR